MKETEVKQILDKIDSFNKRLTVTLAVQTSVIIAVIVSSLT